MRKLILAMLLLAFPALAQNRLEGYNIVLDVPTTHRQATCAVNYLPPTTPITITDLDSSTPLRLTSCDGTESSLTQSSATTATMRASARDFKWCFRGEDERYRVTFTLPNRAPVSYIWYAGKDNRQRGFYNIRDFGAVGDGRTDDTNAFKSAMAVIASNNGGTLTIPDGDYLVNDAITLPSAIIIQGTNGLHSGASTSDVTRRNPSRITLGAAKTALFRIGECVEGVSIRDIELFAKSNDGTSGIEAVGAYLSSQGFNFDRVIFQGFNRGINAYGLPQTNLNWQFDYIKINACRFIYNRDAGIFVNIRNTDWKIEGSIFVTPRKQPNQAANSIHLERAGFVLIQDTFSGGLGGAIGGTFINILDAGPITIVGSQCEYMTNALVYNEIGHPEAGDYAHPITIINSVFGDPIVFKARRTFVSTGNQYGPRTFRTDERVRVYSTGDRFCFDGHIIGCQGAQKNNFDKATVVFMTGQPSEGQVQGHPTFFGTDVVFGAPVQMPSFPVNSLPTGKQDGAMVYCSNCRRSTTPCQGGGSGAPAMMVGGAWSCL